MTLTFNATQQQRSEQVMRLMQQTGESVFYCKQALAWADGDMGSARLWLEERVNSGQDS